MHYVRTTDGVKIAVYDLGEKNRRTVFLVHGWPLSHKIYEYQIELLLRGGYRVVMMDLRGFGMSDAPAGGYSYRRMAQDLYEIIMAMRLRDIILVGFSMGGAIALRYMRLFKGFAVSRLILLAAAAPCWVQRPDFPYGVSKESVEEMIVRARTDRPQLCKDFAQQLFFSQHSEAAVDWFRQIALSSSGIGTLRGLISLRDEDGRKDLCSVHVPTFLLYGERDQVVPRDLIRIQHEEIRGSKLYLLQQSGHGLMYDQLALFNQHFMTAIKGSQWKME